MKYYTKFKEAVRRNERRQHTKKAKKAHLYIIYAVAFMLGTEILVNTVQAAFNPEPIILEGKPTSEVLGDQPALSASEVTSISSTPAVDADEKQGQDFATDGLEELVAKKGEEAFGHAEVKPLLSLVEKESSFRHDAKNPNSTAYGLFQFLDSTWGNYGCEKTDDPEKQIDCGIKYLKHRYGTPSQALSFHRVNNWY